MGAAKDGAMITSPVRMVGKLGGRHQRGMCERRVLTWSIERWEWGWGGRGDEGEGGGGDASTILIRGSF